MRDKLIEIVRWIGLIVFWIVIIGAPLAILVGGFATVWQDDYHNVWFKILISGLISLLVGVVVIAIFGLLDSL